MLALVNQVVSSKTCFNFRIISSGKYSYSVFGRISSGKLRYIQWLCPSKRKKIRQRIWFTSLQAWLESPFISGLLEHLFLYFRANLLFLSLRLWQRKKAWWLLMQKMALEIHEWQQHSFIPRELQTAKIMIAILHTQNIECFISTAAEIK